MREYLWKYKQRVCAKKKTRVIYIIITRNKFLSCFSLQGQTGFPWIDAIMTQLREEGWIHHLARHAVACFLTRGDLWISWEEGMKVTTRFTFFTFSKGEFCNKIIFFDGHINLIRLLSTLCIRALIVSFSKGVRRVALGRRLVRQRRHVDVALVQLVFSTIFPLLLSRSIRQKGGSEWRLH